MQTLDIPLLRSFLLVARGGSVSAAAQQVGRTQSAVSMQMQRLETIIGEPVLHRTSKGVVLTAAGDRLLAHAERILSAHDEALATLCGAGLQGSVTFGCPEDYLTAFFPDLLRGFAARHGNVEIEVISAPTIELRALLERRRIDAALISLPSDADPDLIIRPESFVWVGNSPKPEILRNRVLPLALSAPDTLDYRAALSAMNRAGLAYRIAFASNSLAALLAITRSGQAISVVTRSAVSEDLHVLDALLPPLPDIGISLSYASPRPSPTVKAFGEYVKQSLRP
tara:strand:+ start:2550 stop:3398 length:849 start_codon:yes stop_codon:yes gene_type:complete